MKFYFLVLALLSSLSCVSVKNHNEKLVKPIAAASLRNDVDYTYQKLQKWHPNLYWYISKPSLDQKFDSLKMSINKPMTPLQFYKNIAPVIASVREGHLAFAPPVKKFTKKELKKLENQKGMFSRMKYFVDGYRLFVQENADHYEGIKKGTEIIEIKGIPTKHYLLRYRKLISGDGYNQTYYPYALAKSWSAFFYTENGIMDSVLVKIKTEDSIKDLYLHREKKSKAEKKKEKTDAKAKSKDPEKKVKDFNVVSKSFNRDLHFIEKDSSIAYMRIRTFSGTYSRKFYKQSFHELANSKTKVLIIDVRDNLGGSLAEIQNLYSYLKWDKSEFITDIEVTRRGSVLAADYFRGMPLYIKPLAFVGYPFYAIGSLVSTKKIDGKFYLRNNHWIINKKPKKEHFRGKVYLLINGSSFSASSILSAKLKGDDRAILVGEETGGAHDGCVAGRYVTKKLPNSNLKLPIGLMLTQPNTAKENKMRGVFPHHHIKPTFQQVLENKDVALEWILGDIFTHSINKDIADQK